MSDSEFFTVEGGFIGIAAGEYPNYEEALKAAQGAASDAVGPILVVRWTRTEITSLQREITVKAEDMTKASPAKPL